MDRATVRFQRSRPRRPVGRVGRGWRSATGRTTPRRRSGSSPPCSSPAAMPAACRRRSGSPSACSLALTLGTALGGWSIVRTIGRRIFPLRSLDGLVSQTSSAGVILAASIAGAPVSTTQVVATSIVGIGVGRAALAARRLGDRRRDRRRLADDDARSRHHRRDRPAGLEAATGRLTMARRLSWFLPENPDVLGMLRKQAEITERGMDALTAWAAGDEEAGRSPARRRARGRRARSGPSGSPSSRRSSPRSGPRTSSSCRGGSTPS